MSHRRVPPIECPLASLGHNLPSEHQYRHPLSSSPLNPNDYHLSSRKSPILNIGADGLIQFATLHETDESVKSIDDITSSHLRTAINHKHNDTSDYVNIYRNPMQHCLSTGGESDSASNYHHHHHHHQQRRKESEGISQPNENILSLAHKRNDSLLMRTMAAARTKSAMSSYNQTIDCGEPYFLENKLRSMYVNDATHTAADRISTYPFAKTERAFDFEYGENRMRSSRPGRFIQRPSSPSETSESDRYLADRTSQESPAPPLNMSRNSYNYLSNHQHPRTMPTTNNSNILMDGLSTRFGRFSPSFDQGYHTLNSPSISATANNSSSSQAMSHTRGRSKHENIFSKLPDDLCIKIFSWMDSMDLSNVSKVCKRFDSLVWRPELWKSITLKGEVLFYQEKPMHF